MDWLGKEETDSKRIRREVGGVSGIRCGKWDCEPPTPLLTVRRDFWTFGTTVEDGPITVWLLLALRWSLRSPDGISSFKPQPVTTPLCCVGQGFNCLPVGLFSDSHFLQETRDRLGKKASENHFHWMLFHLSALLFCFSYKVLHIAAS